MNLREHPFIASISEKRRDSIIEEIEVMDLAHGVTIFEEQSDPDALFLVLEGKAVFTKTKTDGKKQTVSEAGAGSFFGEVGVFTGEKRALGASSGGKSRVARVPEPTVKRIIEDSEPVKKILESVIFHLNNTTEHYMSDVMRSEKLSLVGSMVSSILHDFKNPFAVISLGATLIKGRCGDDEKTAKLCENMEAQIQRMVAMANDLAAFARGEQQIDVTNIAVDELFKEFQGLNNPLFAESNISLEMTGNGLSLEGDRNKLFRVLQNLVFNSVEALLSAGIEDTIRVLAEEDDQDLIISIIDKGPGIPLKIRDTFFEPFVSEGKTGGTGLGSAIAKSIVEAHKGSINFSTSAAGTDFIIRLPKKQL